MNCSIYNTQFGKFLLRNNDNMSQQIRQGIFHDAFLKPIFNKYIHESDVCIDIGAHIGFLSLYLSRLVGHTGIIYAIEPIAFTYYQLCANIFLNNCMNIIPLQIAAYDQLCHMSILPQIKQQTTLVYQDRQIDYDNCVNVGGIGLGIDPIGTIIGKPLDDIIPRNRHITFIKCDAQGSDLKALIGLIKIIQQDKPTIVFEFEEKLSSAHQCGLNDFKNFMNRINYNMEKISTHKKNTQDYLCRSIKKS